MADDRVEIEVEFEPDRPSAERNADLLGDALTKAMSAAIKVFATEMRGAARDIATEFRKIGVDRLASDMHGIVTTTERAAKSTRDFADDLRALEARGRAVSEVLAKTGNLPGLGASIEAQLRKITVLQKDAEQNAVELASNPQLVRAYEHRGDQIRTAISQDVRFINKLLEQQTVQEAEEVRKRTALALSEARERTTAVNAERSRNVVATQRETSLELEAARGANRLRLQDERATARQRLAIFQAATQQIRVLERAIGAGVRGVGSLLNRTTAAVSSSTSTVTNIFRRSNNDINTGLQPALERRSSIFRRELRETESVIQSSTVRQSRLFAQAEAQASRGVAGVASGRSQLGGLLGGGLAIGGGFALITKLRDGFKESVNLNESLNKTTQIFGEASKSVIDFADNSVRALFVTRSAALEAAANFGIFGRSAGLTGEPLADFSKRLTVLATDLASFNNTSIADATTAISAALRGESEPIRKYGVLLDAATLEQRAFNDGITDSLRKLTPMERVLAANAEILAQTAVQQGDAARTADDFANSSRRAAAASTEFFASIAKFAIPLATTITNGLLPILTNLTDLVNNKVGPGLRLLRTGLIGAGQALAALLAAKVAGEALQFLALGIKAVLTPMGLLVTSVALIGAAVKILAERSPQLRKVFDDIRDAIGDRLRQGVDLAQRGLEALGDIIVDTVLPAAERLSIEVRDRLVDGFDTTVRFITGTVIPTFVRFARFLRNEVVPFLIDAADSVRDRLAPAFRTVRDFIDPAIDAFARLGPAIREALSGNFGAIGELLQPVLDQIEPVTDAFRDLGGVVSTLFTDGFDDALDRLRDFSGKTIAILAGLGAGLVLAIVNPFLGIGVAIAATLGVAFGPRLIQSLRPQAEKVGRFLRDIFSPRNLRDVGVGFLQVVRRIGEIVGGIVTDRRFVTALAAVAAAIAATAGAAILGFAEGVAANIPELVDLLIDSLTFAFKQAFKAVLSNPAIIVGAIAGGALLVAVRRAFTAAGAAGATGFVSSFVAGTRSFFQSNAFATGFFAGGAGLQRAADKAAREAAAALVTARTNAARDLALLDQPARIFAVSSAGTATATDDPVKRLKEVEQAFGKAQTAGALFRANLSNTFGSLGVLAGGLAQAIGGNVAGGLTQARAGLSGFATNVKQLFGRLRTDLAEAGTSLGVAIGGAIAGGIGAVLSGQATGNATSTGGKALGIAGILTSALFASAALGGFSNPVGTAAFAAIATIGVVTSVITDSGRAAKLSEERIRNYTDALKDVKTPAEQTTASVEALNGMLLGMSPAVLEIIKASGITVQGLARSITDGTVDVEALEDKLRAAAGASDAGWAETAGAIAFVRSQVDELQTAAETVDLVKAVNEPTVTRDLDSVTSRVDAVRVAVEKVRAGGGIAQFVAGDALDTAKRKLEDTRDAVEDVSFVLDQLNDKRTADLEERISKVSDRLSDARDAAQLARDSITSFFTGREGTTGQLLDNLVTSISGVGTQVGEALTIGWTSALGSAQLRTALDGFGAQISGVIQQAVTENPNITADQLSQTLDPLRSGIQQAADIDPDDMFTQDAANTLIGNINDFLANGDFEASVDFANNASRSADALQEEWNALNVKLDADVVFTRSQIQSALVAALELTPGEAGHILDLANVSTVFTSGFDELGVALGESTVEGYVKGLNKGTDDINTAAAAMGSSAAAALRGELQISSPSKVFEALGTQIPAGLVEGILAGSPEAAAALRSLSSELFNRLVSVPGTLADNFSNVLREIPAALEPIAAGIQPITDSIDTFVHSTFDAIAALEGLAGVDLSKLTVGDPDSQNPNSNAGRTANQFAGDLRFLFNSTQPHPPGWIQTEDGSWVPPEFFAPPPSVVTPRAPSLDVREGDVVSPTQGNLGVGQFIDTVNVYETTNARATARETIMALKTAPFTTAPISTATRIPTRVVD